MAKVAEPRALFLAEETDKKRKKTQKKQKRRGSNDGEPNVKKRKKVSPSPSVSVTQMRAASQLLLQQLKAASRMPLPSSRSSQSNRSNQSMSSIRTPVRTPVWTPILKSSSDGSSSTSRSLGPLLHQFQIPKTRESCYCRKDDMAIYWRSGSDVDYIRGRYKDTAQYNNNIEMALTRSLRGRAVVSTVKALMPTDAEGCVLMQPSSVQVEVYRLSQLPKDVRKAIAIWAATSCTNTIGTDYVLGVLGLPTTAGEVLPIEHEGKDVYVLVAFAEGNLTIRSAARKQEDASENELSQCTNPSSKLASVKVPRHKIVAGFAVVTRLTNKGKGVVLKPNAYRDGGCLTPQQLTDVLLKQDTGSGNNNTDHITQQLAKIRPIADGEYYLYVDIICSRFGVGMSMLDALEDDTVRTAMGGYNVIQLMTMPAPMTYYARKGYLRTYDFRNFLPLFRRPATAASQQQKLLYTYPPKGSTLDNAILSKQLKPIMQSWYTSHHADYTESRINGWYMCKRLAPSTRI